jgi:hypothetical protein
MNVHRFGNHNMKHFFHKMEIKHEGIGVRLTFLTKYFHKWIKPCSFYKYTRLDLQETFLVANCVVCKD